ncbi:MAG TPA: N-acetylmuramoyl-L-alanine amidase [Actinomycetota bacterium]
MKTRVGWLCVLAIVLVLLPSLAHAISPDLGAVLGVEEVVGVPSPTDLRGSHPTEAMGSGGGALLSPPRVVPRSEWGADEGLRFRGRRAKPAFLPVRKLIVHHTVTRRWEPPRRAIRRIYRSHTLSRGFADIAYHYLIAPDGRVFKGRYSGPPGTRRRDRPWADRDRRFAVRGAHALAANDGTVGVALIGNYENAPLSLKARGSLVRLLAWLSDRYGIDPLGSSRYPTWGGRMVRTRDIAGHREYGRTACPGEEVRRELPAIRREVVGRLRQAARGSPDVHGPLIYRVRVPKVGRRGAILRWTTNEPSRTAASVRAQGSSRGRTTVRPGLTRHHTVRLRPLDRGTTYVFRLGGADAGGNVRWSAPHSLRTKP